MVKSNFDPLAKARHYLAEMRQGIFEDDAGEILYPYDFEEEIKKSGIGRDRAFVMLGTSEDELEDFNFLYQAQRTRISIEEFRRFEAEGNTVPAYMCFLDIVEFVQSETHGLDEGEALAVIGLDPSEYQAFKARYQPTKDLIDDARADVERQIEVRRPPPGFDPNLN